MRRPPARRMAGDPRVRGLNLRLSPSPARIRSTIASVVDQPEELRALRLVHKALADVNRLRIVQRLAQGEATVTELIDARRASASRSSRGTSAASARRASSRPGGRPRDGPRLLPDAFEAFARREREILGLRPVTARRAPRPAGAPPRERLPRLARDPLRVRERGRDAGRARARRLGLTPERAHAHRLRHRHASPRSPPPPRPGCSPGSSSSCSASSTCSTARSRGRPARAAELGAFLDSVFDRWGEGIVYVGIAVGRARRSGCPAAAILAGAAMVAAFMVSYTRAKSESLGFTPGTGMAAVGLAPREVRLVILTVGLIAAGLLAGRPADMDTPALRPIRSRPLRCSRTGPHRDPRHHHHHPAHPPRRPPVTHDTQNQARSHRRWSST